ncbi:MAG: amidoligase family protein [Angelakisella sp.]|nr:amidoligase family protein [Angelakisella sp.]
MKPTEKTACTLCGAAVPQNETITMGDATLCYDCAEEHTTICSRCDDRIWSEDDCGNDDIILCSHCRDQYYTTCEHCGYLLSYNSAYYPDDDDEYPYCYECYQEQTRHTYLHEYGYRPEPLFHGNGNRYFGVELEIDDGGKGSNNARLISEVANATESNIYIKTDGSLDDGMEIVTHPMTMEYHRQQMPWREIAEKALELGYYSHRTDTCGLHVHVNRTSFGETREIQDECISRVLFVVERFWEELLRFSRRTQSQVNRWAARYGYKSCPKEILEHVQKNYAGRYTCVNLLNYDTIEFRMFRGTLKVNTILATIELVDEICTLANNLCDTELTDLSWPDFVSRIDATEKPKLIQYLKERRFYVNDEINATEEV